MVANQLYNVAQTALELLSPELTGLDLALEHPLAQSADISIFDFSTARDCKCWLKRLAGVHTHTPTCTESRVSAATFAQPVCGGFGNYPWQLNHSVGAKKLPAQLLATSPSFDTVQLQALQTESIPNTPCSQRDDRQLNKMPDLWSKYMEQPDLPGQGRGGYAEMGTVLPPDKQWHSSFSSHIQNWATFHLSHTRYLTVPALTDMYPAWMPSLSLRSNHVQTEFSSFLTQTTGN